MSQEIAALHTTISVKTQGVEQAATSMNRLSEAQKAMEKAAASNSAKVQEMGQRLGELIDKERQLVQIQQQGLAVLAAQGRGYSDLASSVQKLGSAAAAAEAKLAALKQERADIEKMDVGGLDSAARTATFRRYQELDTLIPSLETNIVDLNAAWRAESMLLNQVGGRDLVKVRAGMEGLTGSINAVGKSAGLNRTTFSSLFTTLMSGRVSANLLSQALFSVAKGATAVVAVAGIAFIAITKITAVVKQLATMAGALLKVDDGARKAALGLRELQGISLAETAAQLDRIGTRLESFGGRRGASDDILGIGNLLALNSGDSRRTAEFANAFQRSIETLNFDALRDAGIDVSELNEQMKGLAGTSEEVRRAFALAFIQNDLQQNMRGIEQQARRDAFAFSELGTRAREGWEQMMADPRVLAIFKELQQQLHAAATAMAPLIKAFGYLLVQGIMAATAALKAFTDSFQLLVKGLSAAIKFLDPSGLFDDLTNNLDSFVKEIEDAQNGIYDFNNGISLTEDELGNYTAGIEEATQATKELRRTWDERAAGGSSIVDSFRGMASAWAAFEDEISVSSALDYFNSIDNTIAQLAEHGSNSLVALKEKADLLFRSGFIDKRAYDQIVAGFDIVQQASGPLLEAVRQIEEKYGVTKTASEEAGGAMNNTLTPSLYTGGDAAMDLTGKLGTLNSQISSVRDNASVPIVLNISGGVMGQGFQQIVGGPGPRAAGRGGGSGNRPSSVGTVNRNISRAERNMRDTAPRFFDPDSILGLNPPPRPTGGGGGGGGSNRLAGIEDIRELFRQINQAILQGIRGGVMFSAAGNSIPAGGINEFLNTKGGTLIQTVNIRGIWDFADPAAKRQIIREMEEAIRNLKRET